MGTEAERLARWDVILELPWLLVKKRGRPWRSLGTSDLFAPSHVKVGRAEVAVVTIGLPDVSLLKAAAVESPLALMTLLIKCCPRQPALGSLPTLPRQAAFRAEIGNLLRDLFEVIVLNVSARLRQDEK